MTNATEGQGEDTWSRLTRRKVVQWGIAYAAGAWGLLQGLGYVSELYDWPRQLQQIALLLLLLGAPIVLTLAWYHGDRGERRATRTELAILTLLFLLGGTIFWYYEHTSHVSAATATVSAPASTAPTGATTADPRPSIAVLPFENRSAKQDDAFFVDGIHDDILTQLTKIGAIKVIARTSVEKFRSTGLSTREIGDKLGVTRILEGGVQRAGDRVRVTVQLIDTATDAHLWAETYDRELTAANVFAIQSEVAVAIAVALEAALTPAEQARINAEPTRNLEAWEAYQIGRQRMANRSSSNLVDAERFFRKAIGLDPKFALAYSGLSDTLVLQIGWSGVPKAVNLARADQSVRKALALSPNLAEAWASSGLVANMMEQFDSAEPMLRRAIELNPNYSSAYIWLSQTLASLGRLEEALAYAKKNVDLDPLSSAANFDVARSLVIVGRFDEAESRYRKVIDLDPSRPGAYRDLAMINAYARNNFAQAIPLAEKLVELDPGAPYASCNLAYLLIDLGDFASATRTLDRALQRMPESADLLACVAWLRLNLGDEAGSARAVRQGLEHDPDNTSVLNVLGILDVQRGEYASARAQITQAFPTLLGPELPEIAGWNLGAALDLVPILRMTGESDRAKAILARGEKAVAAMPLLGENGYGPAYAQIHALRGEKAAALSALREAEKVGWRQDWHYYRDVDPALASIRNEAEFKTVFADIERDMARQRAGLAARLRDVPLGSGQAPK